jgi:hypothetical protein
MLLVNSPFRLEIAKKNVKGGKKSEKTNPYTRGGCVDEWLDTRWLR